MPITISPGGNGVILAPAQRINFSSDFIGPLPSGSFWDVKLFGQAQPEAPWIEWHVQTQSPFNGHVTPYIQEPGVSTTTNISLTIPHDSPARLVVELHDPSSLLDQGSIDANWDVTSGLANLITSLPQTSGGFTAVDRANLQTAVDNTTANPFDTTIPTDLTHVPVGRLVGTYPVPWTERVGPFSLTGRGTLDLPGSGVQGIWTGMRWFYEVIPFGWGMTPGAIDEFEGRPAQLVPIIELNSAEEIGDPILDTNSSGGFLVLDPANFHGRVAYDVAPGFSVSLFMYKIIGS